LKFFSSDASLVEFMTLLPCRRQERLEFLYDSGLAVGKTSSEGFKALEAYPSEKPASASASGSAPSSSQVSFCYIYVQLLILYLENWALCSLCSLVF